MLLRFILLPLLMTGSFAAAMPPTDPLLGKLSIDRAEYTLDDESSYALETEARIGRDIDALLIKLEAEKEENSDTEGELKLMWSHAVSPYWDRTLGIAVDSGEGPDKAWLAAGFKGTAWYFVHADFTFHLGSDNLQKLEVELDKEIPLNLRWSISPEFEALAYNRTDSQRMLGAGLAKAETRLLLRYRFKGKFHAYLGLVNETLFGNTRSLARKQDEHTSDTRWVLGMSAWF